ncbi:hypothetical protein [Pyrococcus yayanosii]|uniref:Uncharacterized protein n=1 Tax=Pyrococcus yayanosii (strain CH1 / JCM 16557) TaxID=529709 RepID=F8AGY1_PYRYC|nr:hypothetical protein [Pyrococcus yayanosii]AEH24039.1 hypothetical protein PYCH_03440 [Pyrococcus yayanosii CH1]
MVETREETVIKASIFVVLLGLITGIVYGRTDHIYRSTTALIGLSLPLLLPRFWKPPEKLEPFVRPLYNRGTIAVLAVFIAVHVSLVNVPFTTIDLFHKEWRDADMISHFLGGLTTWLITAEILTGLNDTWFRLERKKLILYSFIVFFALSVAWEVAEKLSESQISFIRETPANKGRDLVMNTLGALFGLWMVEKREYPFSLRAFQLRSSEPSDT